MDILIFKILADGAFFLALFLPFSAAGPFWIRAGLFLVLVSWCVWLLLNWKRRNLLSRAGDSLETEGKILAAAGAVQWLLLGTEAWGRRGVPFYVAFLVSGMLLLRSGRLSKSGQKRGGFWLRTAAEASGIFVLAGILSSRSVTGGLLRGLGSFYKTLVVPVLELMIRLLVGVLMVISRLFSMLFPGFAPELPENVLEGFGPPEPVPGLTGTVVSETPGFLKLLGFGAAAVALFFFLRFLYRQLSKGGRAEGNQVLGMAERSRIGEDEVKKGRFPEWSREKNVRYYFRKFLRLCGEHEIPVDKEAATSGSVCGHAALYWGMEEEIHTLRDMYLKVRYGEKEEEKDWRQRSREIYKKIKKRAGEK